MARILIIDDDITIVMTLRRLLQKQGYEVSTAADGEQGWQLAQTEVPELIICDWEMPQLNGLEVCKRVKTSPRLAISSFILLTARGALDDRIMGLDAGADDFLAKPPDIGELNARVRAGLRSVQLKRDLRRQKEILEQELAEAAEYVRSLLPEPLVSGAIQTAWAFIPSAQLGGDSFNYHWLDDDHLAIYLLDVSGHGVGSALAVSISDECASIAIGA
ncbi:MAG: response regulator [Synechococcaceae cyanobacterium SM2_3_60]|nr:response regulator [Synechococcaceae cyanobacterium SM2_3_60]